MDKSVETVENPRSPRLFAGEPEAVLGIFAKEPRPGQVKTRLCPPLHREQAAALYQASLEETVTRMAAGPWQTVIFYAGAEAFFRTAFPAVCRRRQAEGDLGVRMAAALEHLLTVGKRAILIGSDTPDLPLEHLQQAFYALHRHDLVLAPATDGGYILIGERRHHPPLFREIPWSTPEVLARTRQRARELGIVSAEVAPWEDMDDFSSLCRLLQRSPLSATAQAAIRIVGDLCPEKNPRSFAWP